MALDQDTKEDHTIPISDRTTKKAIMGTLLNQTYSMDLGTYSEDIADHLDLDASRLLSRWG